MEENPAGILSPASDHDYRLLVDAITDYAVYTLSPEGIVTNWNAGAQRLKGYLAGEIVGGHFSQFYTAEDRATGLPIRALEQAARTGKFEAEGWRLRKDGSRFWAHVVIDPIRGTGGTILGYAQITRDLTERAQAQQQLEQAREALFQSQKMEAIGQLSGGVAHDFNNLLTAILGSLELLGRRLGDDPVSRKLLANAVSGAERGATLTSRMLAFARRQDMHSVSVDIPRMVLGMADLLQRALGTAWTVATRFPAGLSAVEADLNQLETALLNLVVNARDAMPDGGSVTITASEHVIQDSGVLPSGHYVSLSVTDTGIGMAADVLARAAEPFFTTKGIGKGTGLGLSMIHGFAEQLGGRLVLNSELGAGTTAEIWLPATQEAAPAVPGQSTPEVFPAHTPLTILVVDDDVLILMNTVALLEDMGHTVIEAYSGIEALAAIRAQPAIGEQQINLMITDYAMPGLNGAELIDQVCAEFPGIPIVLASGYGELPSEPRFAVRRLGKPFTHHDLKRAVAAATLDQGRI